MAFEDNVTELARRRDITNEPELNEDDLQIERIIFYMGENTVSVGATNLNKAGRLLVEDYATDAARVPLFDDFPCTEEFRQQAMTFFDKRWLLVDPDNPKSQQLLRGLHFADNIHICWKKRTPAT